MTTQELANTAREFIEAYLAWSTCHHAMAMEKLLPHVVTPTGIAFSDDSIHRLRTMGACLSKLVELVN
jgi:hypothetical protein